MKPRWLFLLLILALLLPGTRPRLVSALISSGATNSGSPAENSSETEGEEEEIREGVTTSRHRLALDAKRSLDQRPIPQFKRFSRSMPAAAPVTLQNANGFGGHILC
ncbi:hypothetical protein [Blastopirellula marina]|uniref:Uncharacterized protein n=1 Tax=Blastopirellula marina TaxID=124 RepID=A0A2S8G158_9BACT|nr:hypothetical protein [Blastopirellula marina]PQO37991.1 hypothetical protein C5Y98_07840 [Blastopirellula marina]PTL44647.1 hypothetical protein C5Y97_07840 [Blastopirellula marina]